ncbi:MAG: ABC transporter ATP-binding protein [Chloroflexi bacterium]|nr:ABC transporter ATP-binding protein [Chloroflexota bacterium]
MLEIRDIFKTYEGKPLLRGISFSVAEGETVCLLGASGSGKSTLLRMIAGLENPERGLILFNDLDLAHTPTHLRDFGLVFQDYGLFPHLSIFDNIAFGLKMRNLPTLEISPRVAALLEKVNLTGFETRKVTDLSGGEQQRVALARALAPQPRLLMFDEPLGALDRTLKESLLQELRSILHETKIPAIYVTHDQDEAFTIADRILLLHEGEIVRAGTPAEVWSNPGSVWAATFLDAGNIVEGEIQNTEFETPALARGASVMNVKTRFGVFSVKCGHKHSAGEKVSLLLRQSGEGKEIKLKVEDVLFKRDQFEVRGEGLVFQVKEAPVVDQVIKVRVEVKCLA